MEYSTVEPWEVIDLNGVVYEEQSLYDYFNRMADPRKERGKRYSLVTLLVLIFLAKMGGADTPSAIADWVRARRDKMVELLHLTYCRMPHHNTYRRVFANILDEEAFERLARQYMQGEVKAEEIKLLAFDGKEERGTIPPGELHGEKLVGVYAPDEQVVIAQGRVEKGESEIPAAQRVLSEVDLSGKVLIGDAIHTQRALSEQIKRQQGDFIWTVKENQPAAYQAIETLFTQPDPIRGAMDFLTAQTVNKGHGRIEERSLMVSNQLNNYLDWPAMHQVFRLERTFTFLRKGRVVRVEHRIHYGITSLPRQIANPLFILTQKRKYWQIENGLHYRRDVTFHEDATRMSHPHATRNLATVHNIILSIFSLVDWHNAAQARRFLDANPDKAFSLLIAAHPRL